MAKVELKAPIVDEIKGYVSDAKSDRKSTRLNSSH